MNTRKLVSLAVLASACCFTVSAALAGPLMLGPVTAPVLPKVLAVPIIQTQVQTQILGTYRQVRAFWLSRAIVR
jgi:hypothetical protein